MPNLAFLKLFARNKMFWPFFGLFWKHEIRELQILEIFEIKTLKLSTQKLKSSKQVMFPQNDFFNFQAFLIK